MALGGNRPDIADAHSINEVAATVFALSAKVQGVDFNALCADFSKDLAGLIYGTLETTACRWPPAASILPASCS